MLNEHHSGVSILAVGAILLRYRSTGNAICSVNCGSTRLLHPFSLPQEKNIHATFEI
jgi:hypothetical protein